MGVTAPDLWPDSITTVTQKAPVTILKEQASALGRKTRNIVEAEVRTGKHSREGAPMAYYFYLVAPALQDYRYQLFSISHDPTSFYPLVLIPDVSIIHAKGDAVRDVKYEIETEADLLDRLQKLFSSPLVVSLVQSLIAQSQ